MAVRATGDPGAAIRTFETPPNPERVSCDILIAGGGMGGVGAALMAGRMGFSVCLTEETDWLGGQATAGGVSALDEHKFIEISGATRTYREFRNRIRQAYRSRYRIAPAADVENFNPGACYVSSLCFEPRMGVEAIEAMLKPYPLRIFKRTQIYRMEVRDGLAVAALAYRFDKSDVVRFEQKWVLDATETGDLLPLAGVPYTVGSEARAETNEPHAAREPNPACVQSFTYPFIIERRDGEDHRLPEPPEYARFRDGQPFSIRLNYPLEFGWKGIVQYVMYGDDAPVPNNMSPRPFFPWRRVLAPKNFQDPVPELALINWPRQDYHDESILDRNAPDQARILQQAKRVSFSFLHWLHTEIAYPGRAGKGHPELKLRPDLMDTADGLSKYPYIRESRRIRARGRVVEQDIVDEYQTGARARWAADSVGTGFYMVDIHPCGANERGRMMMPNPFQIPLGTLLQDKVRNFLPAGKNLGVTHLTNGAFRLHPIEWNVGEAAAAYAGLALRGARTPAVEALQRELAQAGVPLAWFDDLPVEHPAFAAIQVAAMGGYYPVGKEDLHAAPDAPITRREAAEALAAWRKVPTTDAVKLAVERNWMAVDHRNWFHGALPLYWTDIRLELPAAPLKRTGPVTRADLARRLTGL